MTSMLLGIAVVVTPFVALVGFLRLAERVQLQREARYARQIALTDAIHLELGAVAAPTVRKRLNGGWLVSMMVPFDRPATVATLIRITQRAFASGDGSGVKPLQIVLTPASSSLAATVR